jgi:hypothetical protein
METICLIIDAIARIAVPIVVPIVVTLIGRGAVEKISKTRLENVRLENRIENIEKDLREHKRGYTDEQANTMNEITNEVLSKDLPH